MGFWIHRGINVEIRFLIIQGIICDKASQGFWVLSDHSISSSLFKSVPSSLVSFVPMTVVRKKIFCSLFSVHNVERLLCHEQVDLYLWRDTSLPQ